MEFDTVLVFLDIILHKVQAYRHLVFNKPPKVHFKPCLHRVKSVLMPFNIHFAVCKPDIKLAQIEHELQTFQSGKFVGTLY